MGDAARLEKNGASKISLDHIIKERYPTFVDALRDLDDALSLLFLFANLPATSTVPPKTIALCQRLCLEFEHYLITSHSLRKSFLSIKGIYYQATIQGQDILWLVPYKFVQRVTGDVDFRIMGTFVEFYTTLLGFVNFRLYTSIGLVYPPKFNAKSDEQGGELGAFTLEGRSIGDARHIEATESQTNGEANGTLQGTSETNQDMQKKIDALGDLAEPAPEARSETQEPAAEETNDKIDSFETTGDGADVLPQPQIGGAEASHLFAPFTFFLSRETPRQPLEFILRAFGCKRVGWDAVLGDGAFTHNESDPTITHQIVDRPPLPVSSQPDAPVAEGIDIPTTSSQTLPPGSRVPGRIYIQPQWVWDCINAGRLLRPDIYAPGATLPPHLSPWIKPTKGAYDPSAPLAAQEREGEAEEAEEALAEEEEVANLEDESDEDIPSDDSETRAQIFASVGEVFRPDRDGELLDDDNGMAIAGSDENEDEDEAEAPADDFAGFDSDASLSPNPATLHQAELEAEALGLPFSSTNPNTNSTNLKGILKPSTAGPNDEIRRKAARKRKEEEEALERRMGMMGRKKRKVLDKMLYGRRKGEEDAEVLRGKRRRIERERDGAAAKGKGKGKRGHVGQ